MNLKIKNRKNLDYMIEAIKEKLQMVNQSLIKSESYSLNHYDRIYDVYRFVQRQSSVSMRSMEGILEELRAIRSES